MLQMPLAAPERQTDTSAAKRDRIELLDLLRGAAMLYVMLYHAMYDLKYMYSVSIPYLLTPGNAVFEHIHTFFLWILFAVSGICTGFSRNSLKRGVFLYIIGWLITFGTSVFMPKQLIVFGVISCFGACMSITALIKPLLDKIPWQALLAVSVIMWILLSDFHRSGEINLIFAEIKLSFPENAGYLYPVGIKSRSFKSADYFPIIPFIFMFLAGTALYRPISERKLPDLFYRIRSGAVGFIGRHSLIFYAAHQPLLILIFDIIFGG